MLVKPPLWPPEEFSSSALHRYLNCSASGEVCVRSSGNQELEFGAQKTGAKQVTTICNKTHRLAQMLPCRLVCIVATFLSLSTTVYTNDAL